MGHAHDKRERDGGRERGRERESCAQYLCIQELATQKPKQCLGAHLCRVDVDDGLELFPLAIVLLLLPQTEPGDGTFGLASVEPGDRLADLAVDGLVVVNREHRGGLVVSEGRLYRVCVSLEAALGWEPISGQGMRCNGLERGGTREDEGYTKVLT